MRRRRPGGGRALRGLQLKASAGRRTPTTKTATLARAVEFLAEGAWQQAHEIVQKEKSPLAAWLHGIVHTLEGDLDNARHWYRKADRDFPGRDAVRQEIAAARKAVTAD